MMQKNKKTLMMTGALLAAGVIAAQAQVGPIYSGDVNYTGTAPGSYTYDEATDTLKVVGCGADIWGTSDSFHFVYIEQDPSEDFDYFVHLSDFTASDGWAKAGLMARETKGYSYDGLTGEVNGLSMAGGDRYVCVQTQKSSGSSNTQWITQWRPQEGYSVSDSQSKRYGTYTFPQWLRLRRIGNDFHAVVSADGENWEKLYTVKTDAAEYPGDAEAALWEAGPLGNNYNPLTVGVFITSHNAELNDAVLTGNMFQVFPQEPVAFERELEGGEIYAGTDYILSAKVSGYSPYTYVWKKDGVVLTQGTELFNSTFRYKISAATLEDSGSYTLEVSNVANGVTTTKSSTVTLSVVPDEDAPTVVGAQALNNTIGITFNEAVDQTTATTVANYTVEGKTVTEVKMNSLAPERVTLVLNSAVSGSAEVTIKDVADRSGNVMEGEATVTAVDGGFAVANTGNPFSKGTAEALGHDGFHINNQGMANWGTYDEATLVYKQYTGDFDIRARMLNQDAGTFDSRAGLIIRNALDEGKADLHSSYMEVHHMPNEVVMWDTNTLSYTTRENIDQDVTQFYRKSVLNSNYRLNDGGTTAAHSNVTALDVEGESVTPYDYLQAGNKIWLRLGKVGKVINSYYGIELPEDDGKITWTLIGSQTMNDMGQTVYAGPSYCVEGMNIAGCSESLTNEFKNPQYPFYMSLVDYVDDQVPYEEVAIQTHPVSKSIKAPQELTLTVRATGDPLTYQWYKDGVAIEGEIFATYSKSPTSAADAGEYYCEVMNFGSGAPDKGSSIISETAIVKVEEDTTAPTATVSVVPVRNLVTVNFSETMNAETLADSSNYKIILEDGTVLEIEDLVVNGDNTSVQFIVPGLEAGMTFAVEMEVMDPSGNEVIDEGLQLTQLGLQSNVSLQYYDYGNDDSNPADLAAFKNLVDGGAAPTSIVNATAVESPSARGDYYCTYIEGYLVPPQTGNYRFAVSSDDQSQFYLSTDVNPENLVLTAEVTGYSEFKQYGKTETVVQSKDVALTAGNWYYFRIYHFEGSGGDSVTLAWSLPSQGPVALVNNDPSVSSFFVMDPLKTVNPANTVLEFVEEPATSVSVVMNSRLELSIPLNYESEIEGEEPVYQWFVKNDGYGFNTDWRPVEEVFNTAGEDYVANGKSDTLSIKNVQSMHAGTYKMEAYFGGKHIVTPEITLNVTQDVTAPTATAVGSYTMEQVKLTFSEPISSGLDNKNNYSIDGLEVLDALVNIYGTNRYEVMLQTTRHEEGKSYTVHVSGLSDDAGNVMNNYTTKFTGFVWASGYTYLECFNDTIVGTTDTYVDWLAVREATQWTPVDHAYRILSPGSVSNTANPKIGKYIEITSTDFNQDNCIERVVGYLAPQVSGNYRFAGSCDDHMGLYISTDESYVNIADEPVTWELGWNSAGTRVYDWKNADGNEVTHEMGQVYLEAGKRYFFTAVLAEIAGGDFMVFDWAREGENFQANGSAPLLTGEYLGVYVNPDTAIIDILQQPKDMTVTAGETVEIFVEAETENEFNAPIAYQWYVDGVAQEGATSTNIVFVARPEYDGMTAYCELYVPGKTVLTDEVTLTVEANEVPVLPIYVYGFGSQVIVEFDGAVDPESAVITDNYTIEGATVTGAKIQSDAVVELTVEGAAGSTITVTVAEVGNASGLPMPEPVTVVGDYCILNQTIMNPSGVQGYAKAADGKIHLYNGGGDFWNNNEVGCLILSEPVEGDFDVVLCVESIEANNDWSKVGLNFRASLDADSPHVAMLATPVRIQATTRPNPAGSSSYDSFPQISVAEDGTESIGLVSYNNYSYETYPSQWLRIKRQGDVFFCYRSLNGKYWTLVTDGDFTTVGTNSTYQMPSSGYLGIVYSTQDQNNLHEAVVSGYNSSYVEPALPVPDESEFSFANVGQEENAVVGFYDYDAETGTFEIWGNGSDVWGTSDHFSYVYREVPEGDFTFTARIVEFPSSANNWSKAGIMLREGTADGGFATDSRYIATQTQRSTDTDASGDNTKYVGFWRDLVGRQVTDDYRSNLNTDALVFPHWQRLTREGNSVRGYISLDGVTWTEYMSVYAGEWEEGELGSTLPLYVGLWSTSHSTLSTDSCAVFDNVSFVSGGEPPAPEGPVLAYAIEGEELVLRWAVSSGAVLEVSSEANGQWVLAGDPAEIEDGTYIYRLPLTEAAAFYRLIVE